jgi:HSP20 family protein
MTGPVSGSLAVCGSGYKWREEVNEMAGLIRREHRKPESFDVFSRLDRLFDEWTRMMPLRPPFEGWWHQDLIQVDEYRDGEDVVVRAELPGIDPDRDVEVTVTDGMLHIQAQRREEEKLEEKGFLRRELRYGSFDRTLPLPEGVVESDITARYRDGILEIRFRAPKEVAKPETTKIQIERG